VTLTFCPQTKSVGWPGFIIKHIYIEFGDLAASVFQTVWKNRHTPTNGSKNHTTTSAVSVGYDEAHAFATSMAYLL